MLSSLKVILKTQMSRLAAPALLTRSPAPGLPAFRHSVSIGFPPHASAKLRTLSREDRSQANAPAAPDFSAAALAFASVRQAT